MSNDFRVRRGTEHVAVTLQPRFEFLVVLDDPVVRNDDHSFAADVRMSIRLGGWAMGRPARVPNAKRSTEGRLIDHLRQRVNPTGGLANIQLAGLRQDGHPRTVVTAVLQATQAFQQKFARIPRADVSDDSTHLSDCSCGSPT